MRLSLLLDLGRKAKGKEKHERGQMQNPEADYSHD